MTVANDDRFAPPPDALPWFLGALATLRARLWLVAAMAGLFLLAAVVYLRTADYTYTAALRVAPAPTSNREAGNLGALSSLATLTGSSFEGIPVTPFRLYVEGLTTREVATRLAADPALMHRVFADEWDAATNAWHEPQGVGRALRRTVNGLVGMPATPWSPPDAARLQAWIAANLAVEQTPKTPIVTLSIASTDRAFARDFLLRLHTNVDAWLRERTLKRTRNNIAYLTQRLPSVTLADHRQALFVTLSDQQQRDMTASNPAAFAAELFGRPTVSPRPTAPRQFLALGLALVFGSLTGALLALVIPRRT